jgi:hypothetical protein
VSPESGDRNAAAALLRGPRRKMSENQHQASAETSQEGMMPVQAFTTGVLPAGLGAEIRLRHGRPQRVLPAKSGASAANAGTAQGEAQPPAELAHRRAAAQKSGPFSLTNEQITCSAKKGLPMGDLAEAIYDVLRQLVARQPRPRITYQDLIDQLPRGYRGLSPRSPELSAALGEIVEACRQYDPPLPALLAVVINVSTGRPGPGYYPVAHPDAASDEEQRAAWEAEVSQVPGISYPVRLL